MGKARRSMSVDVSEIKAFHECKRMWKLSSRNGMHLRPFVTPPAYAVGTLFHNALHSLYTEVPLEKVMDYVKAQAVGDEFRCLFAMVPGYADTVLVEDLERYEVLEIEHRFSFLPRTPAGEDIDVGVNIVGSIDMIVLDRTNDKVYGFEHKTAKNFRQDIYMWMDEQPRVYSEALIRYLEDTDGLDPSQFGGIYINEVKKLLRQFQYKRTLCEYPGDDLQNFMTHFYMTALDVKEYVSSNDPALPCPGYMKCQMCTYATICETYMYSTLDEKELLAEFQEEFQQRLNDHLDDKGDGIDEA